jgi:UDP-GlcNAc:undecaprenyl-phosphate GlcNAc-1-phosphate transferase
LPTPLLTAILPAAIACLATYLFVPQVRKFAIECRVADKPNGRRLHAHVIPHLGGIAIFGGVFLALLVSLGVHAVGDEVGSVLALLPALVMVFWLGLVDDLRGLRAGVKLFYQVLAAVCAVAMGAGFHAGAASAAGFVLLYFVSVLWYVGVCNSVNLIDGLDGLAAGSATIAAAGFATLGFRLHDPAVVTVSLCLIGSLVAFLRFNFHPARIFMGDTGSMFVGFALASLAGLLTRHLDFWTVLLGSAAIMGLPIVDTASAICRRLAEGRHIFEADGDHTHHKLLRVGLSHRGAVLVLYVLEAAFTVLGCGVLLGVRACFAAAVALGLVSALTISALARRAGPLEATPGFAPAVPLRPPVPVPVPVRAARVVPVAAAVAKGEPREDVLASLPPAASRPS